MPENIRKFNNFQYFFEANTSKSLKEAYFFEY